MTVSDLINELMKITNQTADVWIDDSRLYIEKIMYICIKRNEEEADKCTER